MSSAEQPDPSFVTRSGFNLGAPSPSSMNAADIPPIEDYRPIRCVGGGAFGDVWLAERRHLPGVYCAVKVLRATDGSSRGPDGFDGSSRSTRELEGLRTFQTQAQNHPNLVQILHVGRCKRGGHGTGEDTATRTYYVMEAADHAGGAQPFSPADYRPLTLRALLRFEGRLSPMRSVEYMQQILLALEHLHRNGIQHCDVKPTNLIFVRGVLKLADLGLVAERGGEFCGTAEYIPPGSNQPDDLYAAGIVFHEMLTGLEARRFPEWPGDLDPHNSTALRQARAIISRACHRDPQARFGSAAEFRMAVEEIHSQRPQPALSRRGAILAAAAGVAGLGAGATATNMLRSNPDDERRRKFRRPPFDGSLRVQLDEAGLRSFSWVNSESPQFLVFRDENEPDRPLIRTVEFFDMQARIDGTQVAIAGGFVITMSKNPCPRDLTLASAVAGLGEGFQIYLVVDIPGLIDRLMSEGEQPPALLDPFIELLYSGQPTDDPPTFGRFLDRIDLETLPAHDTPYDVLLVVVSTEPRQAAKKLADALENRQDAAIRLGTVERRSSRRP